MVERLRRGAVPLLMVAALAGTTACKDATEAVRPSETTITSPETTQPDSIEFYKGLLIDQMQNLAWTEFHTMTGDPNVEKTFTEPQAGDPTYSVTTFRKDTGEYVSWSVQLKEGDSIEGRDFSDASGISLSHFTPTGETTDRLYLERTADGEQFFIGDTKMGAFDSRDGGLAAAMVVLKGASDFQSGN